MFHTRHFMLLIFGTLSVGLCTAALIQEETTLTVLQNPTFAAPQESYAVVSFPSSSEGMRKHKDVFVAKVRSRLISNMVTVQKEEVQTEIIAESPSYPNTSAEALAYEEVTESHADPVSPEIIDDSSTTSVSAEEVSSEEFQEVFPEL